MSTSRRDKRDFYTVEAQKRGFPARSIFKLSEIEDKFKVLRGAKTILDIGAAPGSWTLFISREILKGGGKIVSCDLNPLSLSPMPENVFEVIGDAFCEENIQKIMQFGPFDCVVSDAAAHTTGNRFTDTSRSEELVRNMIALADKVLKKDGNYVSKIFQGAEFTSILKLLRTKYDKVSVFKPSCSRDNSFETFFVAKGKKND